MKGFKRTKSCHAQFHLDRWKVFPNSSLSQFLPSCFLALLQRIADGAASRKQRPCQADRVRCTGA